MFDRDGASVQEDEKVLEAGRLHNMNVLHATEPHTYNC